MPDAAFKDLCADAGDPVALGRFWAGVLGLELVALDDDGGDGDNGGGGGDARLDAPGGDPHRRIWVNTVPEPRTAKTRLHLDVRLPTYDPAPLVDLGATVVSEPGGDRDWWVLADPEGTTFCAMGPHPYHKPPSVEAFELVVDSADPWAQAQWWAAATGGEANRREGAPWAWVERAAGFPWRYWVFTPVPEPKTVKNRWHWDVTLDVDTPEKLVARGATVLREPGDEVGWWVLADPEGNEFCAFRPES